MYFFDFYTRKKCKKLKKKLENINDRTDSTLIAKTESWPTEIITDFSESEADVRIRDFNPLKHAEGKLLIKRTKKNLRRKQEKSVLKNIFRKILPFQKVI